MPIFVREGQEEWFCFAFVPREYLHRVLSDRTGCASREDASTGNLYFHEEDSALQTPNTKKTNCQ